MAKGVLVVIAAALLVAAPAFGASWRVVKSKSVSGQFAAAAFTAKVRHPVALKVRLRGEISNGNAAVACSRGLSVSSYTRSYSRAGTYQLPVRPRRAGNCLVSVSMAISGGSGRVTLYVYR